MERNLGNLSRDITRTLALGENSFCFGNSMLAILYFIHLTVKLNSVALGNELFGKESDKLLSNAIPECLKCHHKLPWYYHCSMKTSYEN